MSQIFLFILRVTLGWVFFYAGITKIFNPSWSAANYLQGAKTLPTFFQWFARPEILPVTNFLNEWGLLILGLSLIFGLFVRLSGILGAFLMLLYYLPVLDFPYPNKNSFLIDDHIIYGLILLYLAAMAAGRVWGLDEWCANLPICKKYPAWRKFFG